MSHTWSLSHFRVQLVAFSDWSILQISAKDCSVKLEIWLVMTDRNLTTVPDTSQLQHLFACLIIVFLSFMNAKTMLDRQYQLSVIFTAVDQVIHAIKQIKNEMKTRFFIIKKMYQILYELSDFSQERLYLLQKQPLKGALKK